MMATSINVEAKRVLMESSMVRLGQLVLEDPDDTARHHATATLQHICELPDGQRALVNTCLLYTSDAADDLLCVDLGGRRIIKKKKIMDESGKTIKKLNNTSNI
eukprot:TRINITY_DN3151_c0_g1_i2.p2 TRINITY_DN3151_c0_g1~~TRINITY_DN3151_c0_g1_i2.p2  ORF type:complete len:104 (+),score=32.11 TRINITY_DN3151_c0_g1_i2:243-554(+)